MPDRIVTAIREHIATRPDDFPTDLTDEGAQAAGMGAAFECQPWSLPPLALQNLCAAFMSPCAVSL